MSDPLPSAFSELARQLRKHIGQAAPFVDQISGLLRRVNPAEVQRWAEKAKWFEEEIKTAPARCIPPPRAVVVYNPPRRPGKRRKLPPSREGQGAALTDEMKLTYAKRFIDQMRKFGRRPYQGEDMDWAVDKGWKSRDQVVRPLRLIDTLPKAREVLQAQGAIDLRQLRKASKRGGSA